MSDKPLDELFQRLQARRPRRGFRPCAWYNAEGDALEIYFTPEPHVAERLDSLFTLFVAAGERERIVGLAIKNMRQHFGEQSGLPEVLLRADRATVRLLVYGALFAHEFVLRSARPRKGRGPRSRSGSGSDLVNAIVEQFGDTVLELQNLEAVAPG